MAVTLVEIASLAGVSRGTVDRALNNRGRVDPEVAERVPSMVFVVGGGTPDNGYCYGGHHPKVMFDENALQFGAAAYACGASYGLSSCDK